MSAKKKTGPAGGAKPALRVGDEAVREKTGRTWKEWVAALDKAGARTMSHGEIVRVVHEEFGLGPWWRQMVTVGYEQARGLRVKHQTATGFSVSRSVTLAVPLRRAYGAWSMPARRRAWLADPRLQITGLTAKKSLRAVWDGGPGRVDVSFTATATDRCQVAVQHSRLADAREAERMKAYWGDKLARLKDAVAPGARGGGA